MHFNPMLCGEPAPVARELSGGVSAHQERFGRESVSGRIGPLLILPRGAAELAAKHGVQVLRRFEAAILGNVGNRRVGVFQSVGGGGQFEAQDFVVDAATPLLAKVRFQR